MKQKLSTSSNRQIPDIIRTDYICEFCGELKDFTAANSFHGFYCLDCLELEQDQISYTIEEIEQAMEGVI